LVRLPRHTF
jgi:regulator of protease activity HflC (stomatin/prohibitin superfamily)